MARLIDADALHRKVKMETNPYGKPTIDYDSGVKVLEWIDKAPIIDAVPVVRCKDCPYFEPAWGDELLGRCKQAKAWYENRCIWDYCSNNSRTTETAEPQPDGIQFRTVDDLGRICIPKDIRDKLGIKPGTECAVYSTDELTPDEIIVIRRNKK